MKGPQSLKIACLLCLAMLPAVVQAQFTYTTNSGTITITGYTGSSGAVIPSTINGLPVTDIGRNAFYYSYVTSVIIGTNVVNIGTNAFFSCTLLTNVVMPNSVTNIASGAFYSCRSFVNVTMSTNVVNIGGGAFASDGLTNIVIPNSVTTIGSSAFASDGLTSIEIPNGVTTIGSYAFADTDLQSVTIPSSVTNIGMGAFEDCYYLPAILVDTNNLVYVSIAGVLYTKNMTTLEEYPTALGGDYSIPGSVTSIRNQAFHNCYSLTNVTIPNSVTNIGSAAFVGCGLTNILIPASVTSIGSGAFQGNLHLTTITVDSNNPAYMSVAGVLFDKNKTTLITYPAGRGGSYTIPDGVSNIASSAFIMCLNLTNVVICNSVTNVGDAAFSSCLSLTSVVIPNSVTNIGNIVFDNCSSLTSITIPASIKSIGGAAFESCYKLTRVYFEGNAPNSSWESFLGDNNAIVYRLSWATGWNTTFASLPVTLWLPEVQTSNSSFGVSTNGFGFNIKWVSGTVVVVDACTNLSNPNWQPVRTNMLTTGSAYFNDPQWTNYPGRFYRLRSP